MSTQFQLLRERRFGPFFATQFLGAFNDNVFKTALITLVTFRTGQLTTLDGAMLATLLPGLFILPFFLFSATSGQIADKFDKSSVARAVKVLEIGIMLLAAWGFLDNRLWPLVTALFLMGLHSTLFGPVKYAYLPQHLRTSELVGGNGMLEMGTFVAILLGQVLGAALAVVPRGEATMALTVVGLAVLGYGASRGIPPSPAADPGLKINWNPVTETWRNIAFARGNRVVWLAILGNSWFWFYGATLLAQFPNFTKAVLGGDESVFILLLTVFSFGIGAGSLLCEKLSGGRVEIGLVPFGAIGLTLFGVDLHFASAGLAPGVAPLHWQSFLADAAHWRVLADIVLLGLFGGFYIVPLYALIQTRSDKSRQSRVIAANNIVNSLFMVVSAAVSMALFQLGLDIPQLFLATALFTAVVAIYIYTLVPEFLIRFLIWLLVHSVYRLQQEGVDNIPPHGPALLACNHVSYVDALIIAAVSPRPIRFIMHHRIYHLPLLNFIFREGRAIPIASTREDPALLERAYAEVAKALAAGELVAIFPEGSLSESGAVMPFRAGITRILDTTPVPVVPIALRGLWGSAFSRQGGSRLARLRPFKRVEVRVGTALPPQGLKPEDLRARIVAMRGDVQ